MILLVQYPAKVNEFFHRQLLYLIIFRSSLQENSSIGVLKTMLIFFSSLVFFDILFLCYIYM